jgi:hypothetical protein
MASLFKLVGSIFIDNEEANQSLSKTESKASSLGNTLLSGAKTAGKFAAGLTTAAAGAAAGLTKVASDAASSMDVIDKASQRMGVSAEEYQEFAHVAELCGVEMSTLEKAAKNLDEGVTFEDAMAQIYALEDANERAQMAAQLFGDTVAYNLTPMLNATGEEMDAMKQQAYDLGLVFSQDTVSAGAQLNDAMTNVKDAISALGTNVGTALMPVVMEACSFITENLPLIQGLFDQLAPVLVGLFETLMPQIMELAQSLLPVLLELFNALLPLFSSICEAILPVIVQLIQTLLPPVIQIVQALLPVLVQLLNALLPILQPIISLLTPIINLLMTLLKPLLDLINFIIPPLTSLITAIVSVLSDKLIPAITKFVSAVSNTLVNGFDKIKEKLKDFKDKFVEIFTAIKDGIKTPINAVIGFINGLVSGVVSGINGMIRAMNKLSFDVPDWVPGMGGKTFGFNLSELTAPQIPLLAEGAVIEPNRPFAAVLGDQRSGTNVEAPLDTIKQAVAEVLTELSLAVTLNASPDTARWFSEMQIEGAKFNRRTGLPSMP